MGVAVGDSKPVYLCRRSARAGRGDPRQLRQALNRARPILPGGSRTGEQPGLMTAAAGAAGAGGRRRWRGSAAFAHDAKAPGDHAANRFACFRMFGEWRFAHALPNLEYFVGSILFRIHSLVDINGHSCMGFTISHRGADASSRSDRGSG